MYLEKRSTKNGIKYYLAHSFREGGKVQKVRVYLGSNLTKKILLERQQKAEQLLKQQVNSFKIIKSPLKYKLTKRDLELIKALKKKRNFEIFHLSESDGEYFTELFTYNTNAIEGSTITQNEVLGILKENKWPHDKPKEEISEAYGVSNAIKHIRKTKVHLSLKLILEIHRIIFENSKAFAGKFRQKGVEVGVRDGFGNIIHLGAPSNRVITLLNELIKWYNENKNKLPAIVLAAVVHNQFEHIHPFEDGNGRVGRLLLNNILIKHKLPPVNISMKFRKGYYETIQSFQGGNIKPSIDLILKEYKELKKEPKKIGVYKMKKIIKCRHPIKTKI